jgi:hypothetical protein
MIHDFCCDSLQQMYERGWVSFLTDIQHPHNQFWALTIKLGQDQEAGIAEYGFIAEIKFCPLCGDALHHLTRVPVPLQA